MGRWGEVEMERWGDGKHGSTRQPRGLLSGQWSLGARPRPSQLGQYGCGTWPCRCCPRARTYRTVRTWFLCEANNGKQDEGHAMPGAAERLSRPQPAGCAVGCRLVPYGTKAHNPRPHGTEGTRGCPCHGTCPSLPRTAASRRQGCGIGRRWGALGEGPGGPRQRAGGRGEDG